MFDLFVRMHPNVRQHQALHRRREDIYKTLCMYIYKIDLVVRLHPNARRHQFCTDAANRYTGLYIYINIILALSSGFIPMCGIIRFCTDTANRYTELYIYINIILTLSSGFIPMCGIIRFRTDAANGRALYMLASA